MHQTHASHTTEELSLLEALGFSVVDKMENITEYKLVANGLTVLLSPLAGRHTLCLAVHYRVGSRNEGAGYTGSTHFLEHMMFKGTPSHNPANGTGFFQVVEPKGHLNAFTSMDHTCYWQVTRSAHLPLLLTMEADRMHNLLLRAEDHQSEMVVVRNERERSESSPHSIMVENVFSTAFREHPYHNPVIGFTSDVEGVPLSRLRRFYDDFYHPGNATLILHGGFDRIEALRQISETFGKVPPNLVPAPELYTTESPQAGERRFEIVRQGLQSWVTIAFHVPNSAHPDTYALEVIAAVLGRGSDRSSRLSKRMVARGLCSSANAWCTSLRDPGLFFLSAIPAATARTSEVEAKLLAELERLQNRPLSKRELARVKEQNRTATILGATSIHAQTMSIEAAHAAVDWRWGVTYDKHLDAVTPDDVQRVARLYFRKENRTVGTLVPRAASSGTTAAQGVVTQATPVVETAPRTQPAQVATIDRELLKWPIIATTTARTSLPTPEENELSHQEFVLPNGLRLLVKERPDSRTVSVNLRMEAGTAHNNARQLTPYVASSMLLSGSAGFSRDTVADSLAKMGLAGHNFNATRFSTNFGATVKKRDLRRLFSILGDALQHPNFDMPSLVETKNRFESRLKLNACDPHPVATTILHRALYDETSVYWMKDYDGRLQELAALGRAPVAAFHDRHFRPERTHIAIVGGIKTADALALVTKFFGTWQQHPAPYNGIIELTEGVELPPKRRIDVRMPDQTSAVILFGKSSGLSRKSPDYVAAQVANEILGNDPVGSRLGTIVRDRAGLTYGVGTGYSDLPHPWGTWRLDLTTNPENVERAIALVEMTVQDYLDRGISESELAKSVENRLEHYLVNLEDDQFAAGTLVNCSFHGMPVERIYQELRAYRNVTPQEVQAAAQRLLGLNDALTIVAGAF